MSAETPRPPFRWLRDGYCRKSDFRLVRRAIRERWPMPEASRAALIAELAAILGDTRRPREIVAAARTLLAMIRADVGDARASPGPAPFLCRDGE